MGSSGQGEIREAVYSTADGDSPRSLGTHVVWSDSTPDEDKLSHLSGSNSPALSSYVELPSIGSAGHYSGNCKPCCFHTRPRFGECIHGYECKFCHLPHEREKKKNKRDRQHARLQ